MTDKIPETIQKHYMCKLLHSKIPTLTGKLMWDEEKKEYIPEIIWMCKEGCKAGLHGKRARK